MLAKEVKAMKYEILMNWIIENYFYLISPESRPLFNVLERRFANMLGEDVANVSGKCYIKYAKEITFG